MASMPAVHAILDQYHNIFHKIAVSGTIICAEWVATFGYLCVQCGKYAYAVGIVGFC
jgi:hypothetical protein